MQANKPANRPPSLTEAVITDVDAAGKILALEQIYCDQCGRKFALWPPDLMNEHLHDHHAAMFWPAVAQEWEKYKRDPDLVRRKNFVTQVRVRYLYLILGQRCDLFLRLVEAGVIIPPAAGAGS